MNGMLENGGDTGDDGQDGIGNNNNNNNNNIDLQAVIRLQALELQALPADRRNMIQEEVHGVRSLEVPETPQLVSEATRRMIRHVDVMLAPNEKRAYNRAMVQSDASRTYVTRPAFLLQFLRAELFHPGRAAVRYCKWLDLIADYFGDTVALERDVYLTDLTRDDHRMLRDGFMQLLPHRDRCGRRVRAYVGSSGKMYTVATRMRVVIYQSMIMAEDELTQRRGTVSVLWPSFDFRDLLLDPEQFRASQRHIEAVPARNVAFHICMPNHAKFRLLYALTLWGMGSEMRQVVRVHVGSHMECEYSLRTYGIPTDSIPKTYTDVLAEATIEELAAMSVSSSGGEASSSDDNRENVEASASRTTTTAATKKIEVDPSVKSIKTKNLSKWIKFRATLEEAKRNNVPFAGVECPGLDCVLFRVLHRSAGVACQDSPANVTFRQILARTDAGRPVNCRDETAAEKEALLQSIIDEAITVHGLTFMAWDAKDGCYVKLCPNADHVLLRKQVFQALRNQRKRNQARASSNSGSSISNANQQLQRQQQQQQLLLLQQHHLHSQRS